MAASTKALSALVAGLVAVALVGAGNARSDGLSSTEARTPLLGANLVQYRYVLPYCWGNHILLDYDRPGVREVVVPSLHAMRAAGLETFRLFLYHTHATSQWIPSASGRLDEPYRTNLTRLLGDIRAAGLLHVTVTFNPRGANDPTGAYADGATYDPALFEENWRFVRDVREVASAAWRGSTRFDLLNEGAPSDWDVRNKPWWGRYLVQMYTRYVDAFGADDVTISAIAKGMWNRGDTSDDVERMQNLIEVFRASGKPLPRWIQVHPSWDAGALDDLRAVDEVLARNGLSQPLVIGEERYNDAEVASAIATFMRTSARPVIEVMEWPLYDEGGRPPPTQPRCSTLPFRIDAYAKALRGAPPSRALRGSVGSKGQLLLLTPYGHRVRALVEGTYTVAVRDASARHSFRLSGAGLDRRSGLRFTGTRTWRVTLRGEIGSYTYASDGPRGTSRRFSVLVPG